MPCPAGGCLRPRFDIIGERVESLEIDGVWVFQHESSGGDDALHSGVAEIKNDCLYVDDAVAV